MASFWLLRTKKPRHLRSSEQPQTVQAGRGWAEHSCEASGGAEKGRGAARRSGKGWDCGGWMRLEWWRIHLPRIKSVTYLAHQGTESNRAGRYFEGTNKGKHILTRQRTQHPVNERLTCDLAPGPRALFVPYR